MTQTGRADIVVNELTETLTEKITEKLSKQYEQKYKEKLREELAAKDAALFEKDAENARLRAENDALKQAQNQAL